MRRWLFAAALLSGCSAHDATTRRPTAIHATVHIASPMKDTVARDYRRCHDAAFSYVAGEQPDPAIIEGIRLHEASIQEAASKAQKRDAVDRYAAFLASHEIR